MLKDFPSSAILAVSAIARARAFYSGTLGLELADEGGGGGEESVLTYRTGVTNLVVYASDYAGTNQANAVVWGVGDEIEAIVADLRAKGVAFEHYPGAGEYRDGIHHSDGMKLAWLKDPDGNILHINSF